MAHAKPPANKGLVPGKSTDLVIPPKPGSKEERIHYIVDLMAKGKWVTGVTGRALATAWGYSVSSAMSDASDASNMLRAQINTDEIRAQVVATLQSIGAQCLSKEDTRNAIRSLEALGRVIGTPRPSITIQGGGGANNIQIVMLPPEDSKNPYAASSAPAPKALVEAESGATDGISGE
jgi:hypothetical protein